MPSGKIKKEEEIKSIVENLGYIYIESYRIERKPKRVVFQDGDGYKYDIFLGNFLKKDRSISFVHRGNPFTLLHNIPLWLKLNKSQFELLENNIYLNAHQKLSFYCNKCKDYPKISWNNVQSGQGCGICVGKQTGMYHNLAVQFPDIVKEWHPTKNGDLTPKDVSYGESRKVWWLCSKGHEYFSSINHRTNGRGCKKCADLQRESKTAKELKDYISNKYNAKEEYSIFRNPETNYPLSYDIYIFDGVNPKTNGFYIEIHGYQHYQLNNWHKKQANKKGTTPEEEFEYQKHKDRLKRRFARKNGIYIEVDLRKIKNVEEAIKYVEKIIKG